MATQIAVLTCRLIYPQNSSGEPVMNPNGKYFVSFNLNGCRRRVCKLRILEWERGEGIGYLLEGRGGRGMG